VTAEPQPLTIALVGCGRIGTHTAPDAIRTLPDGWLPLNHAAAIASLPSLRLVGLCDSDPARLARASALFPAAACFDDYRTLVKTIGPQLLSIATRTEGRCDIIEFAAQHGVRGIHAEKPLSRNLRDCRRALDAVRRHGVWLTYGTTRRFMEVYRTARRLVAAGEIGELRQIVVEFGRAALLWTHPHSMDLIFFLADCADVEYAQATCHTDATQIDGNVVDDDPLVEPAFLRLRNGVTGVLTMVGGHNVVLAGSKCNLVIQANGSRIRLYKPASEANPYFLQVESLEPAPVRSGTQQAFLELANAVRGDAQVSISPEEIEAGQRALFALALSSLRDGRRVSPTEVSDDFTVTGRLGDLYA
jgi:predicted dehydrogenase